MTKMIIPHLAGRKLSVRTFTVLTAIVILFILPTTIFAVTAGQVDTFEDGTFQGWADPAGNSLNVTTGGPAGAGDNYMQVSSGSFGGGSHLITYNQSQWIGNYVSAGVSGITMDLKNFGSSTLPIRIVIREGIGSSGTPGYSSTVAFSLPADGAWHTAAFSLSPGSMTPINSPQPLATDLANVKDFRLLSSVNPALIGDFVSGRFGVDNITATVPEPSSLALLALMLGGLWKSRRATFRS